MERAAIRQSPRAVQWTISGQDERPALHVFFVQMQEHRSLLVIDQVSSSNALRRGLKAIESLRNIRISLSRLWPIKARLRSDFGAGGVLILRENGRCDITEFEVPLTWKFEESIQDTAVPMWRSIEVHDYQCIGVIGVCRQRNRAVGIPRLHRPLAWRNWFVPIAFWNWCRRGR